MMRKKGTRKKGRGDQGRELKPTSNSRSHGTVTIQHLQDNIPI